MTDARPVLVVTNVVAPDRVGAFAALHEREGIELALFGGRSHHATTGVDDPGVPHRAIAQREVYGLARSGDFRAVIAGTAGRVALPAAWRGARRGHVPFLLWSALWAHPRTPAHRLAGAPLLRRIYRDADGVVTYGPHVSAFVSAHGARNVHVAPQAVDAGFWGQAPGGNTADRGLPPGAEGASFVALHVGRPARYKGVPELLEAWERSGLAARGGTLLLAGVTGDELGPLPAGVHATGPQPPEILRNFYAAASVFVMPAIETREHREPWGLVANEAMHQALPVLATDAVGAAAGGLIRHDRNGLVVGAGDPAALAAGLVDLHDDAALRARLGASAVTDVAAYSFAAWAEGMSEALASVGASQKGDR